MAETKGLRMEAPDFYPRNILYVFPDGRNILVTNMRHDLGRHESQFPEIVKLDTRTGIGQTYLKNPGNVRRWCADIKGQVRVGIAYDNGRESILYRDTAKDEWRTVANFESELEVTPISFAADGTHVYATAITKGGTEGLYKYDPGKGELGEEIWADPTYDLDGFVREPETRRLLGVRYIAEEKRTKWVDTKMAALQDSVNATLPNCVNQLKSFSKDGKKMLVDSYSDRQPSIAYLYDIEKKELRELGKSRSWIDPEKMAAMHPISYEARDGVRIHAYLTVPVSKQPKNLPLVVLPHGGPWVRDEWEFDPLVQMLANRGYAVLQMNFRGSSGYGSKFEKDGRHEVGGKIQEDIEDGTRWAIAKKIADPKRIAIVGGSFGGYSALYALGKSPELYCCGISIAGVSDWLGLYKEIDSELDVARDHWRKLFGDPEKEEEKLKRISPLYFADQIKAPVLIIQGERDWIVPPRQAKKMISALERAGNRPESLFISDEAHGFRKEKSRIAEFKAIEAFLAKHLGADAIAVASGKITTK